MKAKKIVASLLVLGSMTILNAAQASMGHICFDLTCSLPIVLNDGSSALTPLLPLPQFPVPNQSPVYNFFFTPLSGKFTYIDPVVATGYEYQVSSGPKFASVVLPILSNYSSNYKIQDFAGNLIADVAGGQTYNFASDGVSQFKITGIDPAAGLDPNNNRAFVTGLTFTDSGPVTMTQTPITTDTDANVPEPASVLLLGLGSAAAFCVRRQRKI